MKEDEAKESESAAPESEPVEPESVAVDEVATAEVPAADGPAKRRPLWLHLVVIVLQTLLLVPVYAAVLLATVLAGVGWHYYDASERLDMGLVDRPEIGALVRDVRGEVIGRAGSKNRILIQRDEIPAHFVDALIAAEDQRFFAHPGFDPVGSVRAAWANYRAEAIREGGSTLTQQLARDVYQLEGKDMDRKLSEIAASVRIEQRYSKDEILVHYLNRVYFGSGFYGLGSAARGYFGKRVSELTIDESALICGVIPSPSRYSPFVNPARAREYRDQTLRRMVDTGKLDAKLLDGLLAKETPVASSRADSIERGQVTYLLGRIERELRADMKRWPEQPETLDGYVIDTSVDLALQKRAAKEMDRHLRAMAGQETEKTGGDPVEAAFVMVENRTGQIVAVVGSHDYQRSEYDRATEMRRPPGSAFYPFLYAAAFETAQFTPATRIVDAPFDNREMGLGSIGGVLGEWSTENPENRWEGNVSAAEALAKSKNSPTARLALLVGLDRVKRMARSVGIESELCDMPSSLLGASEASLSELTRAYTALPNEGSPSPEFRLIREVRDTGGKIVPRPGAAMAIPAMKVSTAKAVAECLAPSPVREGARGKTGTTATFTDAWYFGFDPTHTWGVWVGRDRFTPIRPLAFGGALAKPLAEGILAGEPSPVASSSAP